jgi:hypothetical protein
MLTFHNYVVHADRIAPVAVVEVGVYEVPRIDPSCAATTKRCLNNGDGGEWSRKNGVSAVASWWWERGERKWEREGR